MVTLTLTLTLILDYYGARASTRLRSTLLVSGRYLKHPDVVAHSNVTL